MSAAAARLMLVAGVATGVGHALAVGDPGQVLRITAAATGRIPAVWVLVALVVAVWGRWPHATAVVWGAYTASIFVGEFGQLWGVPQWLMDLSPFAHSPVLPGPDADFSGAVWLTVVAAALLAGGSIAFRRRDLAG